MHHRQEMRARKLGLDARDGNHLQNTISSAAVNPARPSDQGSINHSSAAAPTTSSAMHNVLQNATQQHQQQERTPPHQGDAAAASSLSVDKPQVTGEFVASMIGLSENEVSALVSALQLESAEKLITDALSSDPAIMEQVKAVLGPPDASEDTSNYVTSKLVNLLNMLASAEMQDSNDASIQTAPRSPNSGVARKPG